MKHILLIFCICVFFFFAYFGRYRPVSLDLVQPTTKQVEIKGEVLHPGVYTLKKEGTLQDLISKAGGFTDEADTDAVSMVKDLYDKDTVVIRKKGAEDRLQVSINNASLEEFEQLPGIGPAIAQRIIDYRKTNSFQTLEDIMNVKGIGPKMFEKIQAYIIL